MDLVHASLYEHLQLLFVGVCLIFISTWIAYRQGFFRYPESMYGSSDAIRGWDVFRAFFIFLFMTLCVVPTLAVLWFWVRGEPIDLEMIAREPLTQGWLNVFGVVLSAAAVFTYVSCLKSGAKRTIWGAAAFRGGKRRLHDMFVGAITWLLGYPWLIVIGQAVAVIVLLLLQEEPSHYDQVAVKFFKSTMGHPLLFAITLLLLIFVIPAMEEILFRGFLQTWLKQKWGRTKAIFVASLIFAAFHFSVSQGLNNIELLVSLFVLSCFLGFLYERQESLLASMALHATFNAVSILAILE
jgi:hypothetical protein